MTAVVFDLDGTLIDSAGAVCDVANALMDELGLPSLDFGEARSYVGNGAGVFLENALKARGAFEPSNFDQRLERFLSIYAEAPGEANAPFPGVEAALRELAATGYALGLCTNKPGAPTHVVLDAMGWSDLFDAVITGDMLKERKPHPAPLLEAVRRLGRETFLYVGDSEVDAETAAAADVPFLLYAEGYRKNPIEALPHTAAFWDYNELPALIRSVAE